MKFEKCPKCGSENIILSGKVKDKQRYNCKNCKFFFSKGIKVEPIALKKANKIYQDYLKGNLSNYAIAKNHGMKSTELQRWFDPKFWNNKGNSKNKFKQVAYHSEFTSDIAKYLKPLHPKIRVKPQLSNVVIQYLFDGYKSDPKFNSILFTLFEFRELYGERFCSIKFNFLNSINSHLSTEDSFRFFKDLLPTYYLTGIHLKEGSHTLRNVKVSDFLDDIISNDKTFFYLNLFMEQKNENIKHQIGRQEQLESNRKKEIKEKIQKIKDKRNKV